MKVAVIWRKTVYDTHKCPMCQNELITDDGNPTGVIEMGNEFYCAGCGYNVAHLCEYRGSKGAGFAGELTEKDMEDLNLG